MLCIPIIGSTINEAATQVEQGRHEADLFEFRLDLFLLYSEQELKNLLKAIHQPIIFTLRKPGQGGRYSGTEDERLKEIKSLALLNPAYIDLEWDVNPSFFIEMHNEFPHIKLICSYHDFEKTPLDLSALLKRMRTVPAHLYKIACVAQSTCDAFRLLDFVREDSSLLGVCMGEKGVITRILGPLRGSPWTYASLFDEQKTAPGQLSVKELTSIYPISRIKPTCALYGLIGGTVKQSISHFTHNHVMRKLHLDALYLKMSVEKEELADFFKWAKKFGFGGISVTMPLKEQVLPFLDQLDDATLKIGAVNTIVFREGRAIGYNTDGLGALDAIGGKLDVCGKKMTVLGAGGAARAIIYEALQRGMKVSVLNRTKERALALATSFGISGGDLLEESDYDVLLNTTPAPHPIPEGIQHQTVVMDIKTLPKITPFLKEAIEKNCTVVFGYEMFINQAVRQFALWFPEVDPQQVHDALCEEATLHLF